MNFEIWKRNYVVVDLKWIWIHGRKKCRVVKACGRLFKLIRRGGCVKNSVTSHEPEVISV